MQNHADNWMKLAHESYWLCVDSMVVMGMRTCDIMSGKGTNRENLRMVTEKVEASAQLAVNLLLAGPTTPEKAAAKAVRHYRKRVSANRRRLSRK